MVSRFSFLVLFSCLLVSLSCAEPPADVAPAMKSNAENAVADEPSRTSLNTSAPTAVPAPDLSSDRYQLLVSGNTTLLLDRVSGDSWRLVTGTTQKPFWEVVTRQQPVCSPASNRDLPKKSKSVNRQTEILGTPKSKSRESFFNGPVVAGPVDIELIPGLDIVVVRGPKASVRAVKEAVAEMGRAWNGPRLKKMPAKNEPTDNH